MEQGGQSRTLDVERCEQLGIRARNRAIERYNWDQIAQQYLQLLTPKTNPR
jgi:glycosyltransferase involved in cell wall biosynthesis